MAEDCFAFFRKATREVFSFLIEDFDFTYISTQVHLPMCAIEFQSKTTGVTVLYEWESTLWVELTRLRREGNQVGEWETYGLHLLLMERSPNKLVKQVPDSRTRTDAQVNAMLRQHATALKECASDVLAGDFRIFPTLRAVADNERRRLNKELFGSETGEIM